MSLGALAVVTRPSREGRVGGHCAQEAGASCFLGTPSLSPAHSPTLPRREKAAASRSAHRCWDLTQSTGGQTAAVTPSGGSWA